MVKKEKMNVEEEEKIAKALAKADIQEPFLFRSLARARMLSDLLIDEQGILLKKKLPSFRSGIQGENDKQVVEHFQHVVNALHDSKDLLNLFNRFKVPVANRYIETLILYSLGLPLKTKVTNRELRQAVLTALLTPLRQNVGSCFATAPGIIIQSEQMERLLLDLYDLVMTCSLSRTFGGVQHAVPISPSWGVGDLKKPIIPSKVFEVPTLQAAFEAAGVPLSKIKAPSKLMTVDTFIHETVRKKHGQTEQAQALEKEAKETFKSFTDHALLKAWEYTLASFSDYKVEFFRWNLYASLGFDQNEVGGIGYLFYQTLQQKLTEANAKTEELHQDYARAIDEVRMTQALLRQASSRDRVRQLKAELDVRLHHAQGCKDMRDDSSHRAENLANFFKFLLEKYAEKFPEYFQEIYDAEMYDVETGLYDDAPAGFRLLYKHGRRDPLAWTLIHNEKEYIQSLNHFFLATEPQIAAECEWEEGEKELQELTTLLIHHLNTEEFLTSAIERMGKAHKTKQSGALIENISQVEKKPWSYTSGGTMHTLIRCYYCLEKDLTEEKRPIENPMDLLIFLLDLLKGLPYTATKAFEDNPKKGMLMYSPTHAFVLRPGLSPFKEGWLDKGFSYTWARDHVLHPGEEFYEVIRLDRDMQELLAEEFIEKHFPEQSHALLREFTPHAETLHLPNFRTHLFNYLSPHLTEPMALSDRLDGYLRTAFPLIHPPELEKLLQDFPTKVQKRFAIEHRALYTSSGVFDHLFELTQNFDHLEEAFTKHQLLPPKPLLFADTNWSRFYFGFGYNPGLGILDLWRLDARCREGYPLSVWRPLLDGSLPQPWGVLTSPSEYSGTALPDFTLLKKKV